MVPISRKYPAPLTAVADGRRGRDRHAVVDGRAAKPARLVLLPPCARRNWLQGAARGHRFWPRNGARLVVPGVPAHAEAPPTVRALVHEIFKSGNLVTCCDDHHSCRAQAPRHAVWQSGRCGIGDCGQAPPAALGFFRALAYTAAVDRCIARTTDTATRRCPRWSSWPWRHRRAHEPNSYGVIIF